MKQFLIKLSYTVLPVWLLFVGLVCYVSLAVIPNMRGDLEVLGLTTFDPHYTERLQQQAEKKLLYPTIDAAGGAVRSRLQDVTTVGDSFSQMGLDGYQNYLCQQGLTVTNIHVGKFDNPLEVAYRMLDQGLIDSTNTRVLVIESAERMIEQRVAEFLPEGPLPAVRQQAEGTAKNTPSGNENQWSLARTRDFIYYRLIKSPVLSARLDGDFFTADDPAMLYFYTDDLTSPPRFQEEHREALLACFGTLCRKADEKGVYPIVLIATDKYDFYQQHIIDNPWPAKTVLEDMAQMIGDTPHLLLSKPYLTPLLERGEKDIFKYNDTHWSWKASRVVADELARRINTSVPRRRARS